MCFGKTILLFCSLFITLSPSLSLSICVCVCVRVCALLYVCLLLYGGEQASMSFCVHLCNVYPFMSMRVRLKDRSLFSLRPSPVNARVANTAKCRAHRPII